MQVDAYQDMALDMLPKLVAIPSFSREEILVADFLESYLTKSGIGCFRHLQNVWAEHYVSDDLPTILLNSHIDTVKPVGGWTRDPFDPGKADGKIYGLGSNDAGGALVSLLACFFYFKKKEDIPFNLVFAATAEEEISGKNGITSVLGRLGKITLGIVGEPTGMNMAIAEKGLMVIDCLVQGESAHAASGNGINAIYESMRDLEWIRCHTFDKTSEWLGNVSMQVTQITAGNQHNVVPDTCNLVIDVRTNECYTNEDVFGIISEGLSGIAQARSFRLRPSFIEENHPVVRKGKSLGLECYGSLTLSDQALMPFPTLKIGPGYPGRSHIADEYIETAEIRHGVKTYIELLDGLTLKHE
jgi:acetylornithine deacetylase